MDATYAKILSRAWLEGSYFKVFVVALPKLETGRQALLSLCEMSIPDPQPVQSLSVRKLRALGTQRVGVSFGLHSVLTCRP